jgi:hypothetical protein
LIEGEGSFHFQGPTQTAVIKVAMTDEDVIRKLHAIAGCGNVYGPWEYGGRKKPIWCWSLTKARYVYAVACAIYPFMCSRRSAKMRELLERIKVTQAVTGRRHGTISMHRGGCRCEPCVEARRTYNRNYMRQRREAVA